MLTEIVYEDKEVLVVRKPAGLATQTARVGQQDVVSELKNYLRHSAGSFVSNDISGGCGKPGSGGKAYGCGKPGSDGKAYGCGKPGSGGKAYGCGKPGGNGKNHGSGKAEPYLGVIHRLDQPVEGLLVFAKNRAAACCLTEQLQGQDEEENGFSKHYHAVLCGIPARNTGRLTDILSKESVMVGTHREYRAVVNGVAQEADILRENVRPTDAGSVRASSAHVEPVRNLPTDTESAMVSPIDADSARILSADADSARTPFTNLVSVRISPTDVASVRISPTDVESVSVSSTNVASVSVSSANDGSAGIPSVPGHSGENLSSGHRAELEYEILQVREAEGLSLADIRLITGRFHQIRAQMAHAGTPLLGDMKYGSEASKALARGLGVRYVALCACSLEFRHPVSGKRMEFRIEPKNPAFSFFSQL